MQQFEVSTTGRTEFVDITAQVRQAVGTAGIKDGVVTVFVPHTTAGVTLNENSDPDVLLDMEAILDKVVPWAGGYHHNEGNSAAHLKSSLMGASAQIIVSNGRLQLGVWQAIYFCEFDGPRQRKVWVQI